MYVADEDYDSGSFDVTFGAGDTSAKVSINITDDYINEESEVFGLVLTRKDDTPDLVEIVEPINVIGIIDDNDETGMLFSLWSYHCFLEHALFSLPSCIKWDLMN